MNEPPTLVLFRLDEQRYALPLEAVDRVVRAVALTPLPCAPPIVLGVIDVAGTVIPVLSLRRRFGRQERPLRVADHLVLAHTARRMVALLVDEPIGVVPHAGAGMTAAARIAPSLEQIDGALRLDDGLVFIYDLAQCLSPAENRGLDAALAGAHAHERW